MLIEKVMNICFSPTGSTEKISDVFTQKFSLPCEKCDLTLLNGSWKNLSLDSKSLAVISVPVYGGRVPFPAAERILKIKAQNTPAVLLVVYGNRAYDDALLELYDLTSKAGFKVVAAAAFVAEHSLMHSLAAGRPDQSDRQKEEDFAQRVEEKLKYALDEIVLSPSILKGNFPYVSYSGIALKPKCDEKVCVKCGICSKLCPVGAISVEKPFVTNYDVCFSCMRCLKVCPHQARFLDREMLAAKEKIFYEKFSERKEPEIFI